MTRFARAEGSKGSNKREEEEATPWSVMVQQVKGRVGGVEDEDEDFENVDEKDKETIDKLLGPEEDDDSGVDQDEHMDTSLLDLPDTDNEEDDNAVNDILGGKPLNLDNNTKRPLSSVELVSSDEPKKKKRKKSQKCKVCGEKDHLKKDCEKLPEERRKELQELYIMKVERKGKGTGRKKNKNKNNLMELLESKDNIENSENQQPSETKTGKKSKKKKLNKKNRGETTLTKDRSGAVIEEGEALFQGFRVTKEDQLRLKKLSQKLKSSGATKEETEFALKRERRRAEKSLARSKKLVCFNCREPGHMLADCPSTDSVSLDTMPSAAGHCFKCGSLEHTSKDCKSKLKRENAYRFAVCFICKQEGHLAKACPDNPKGLYPNGGGCVFCGSVEHLKRDCPRKAAKDERQGVKVGMISHQGLEDEPDFSFNTVKRNKQDNNKQKKVVSF